MKLKVKKNLTAQSSPSIILMCTYIDKGVKKKFIQAVDVGSTIEVEDCIGAALLNSESHCDILSIDNSQEIQRKMVDPKKALDSL